MRNKSCAAAARRNRLGATRHADSGVAGGVNKNSLNGACHPAVGMPPAEVPKNEGSS